MSASQGLAIQGQVDAPKSRLDRSLEFKAGPSRPRKRTRVLVVDDHPIACAGVVSLLNCHDWLEVVGQADNGEDALMKIRALLPDLVVADINLPKISGLAVTKYISAELPGTRVVILSMHAPETVADAVLASGARGYVCKKVATTELMDALEAVAAGGTYFGPDFLGKKQTRLNTYERPQRKNGLSPREREVLVGIAEGLSNKEVAGRLGLGVRTVETHRESVMRKLNIHNVAGLTRFALQKGLVLAE